MEYYLDNSATTRVCPEAAQACVKAMEETYGNPSSLHRMGYRAEQLVRQASEQLGAALSCAPEDIIYTSGATEANNLALFGVMKAYARQGKTLITTAIEHPSISETAEELARRGFRVKRLPPLPDGTYSPRQFAEALDEDTVLVSCMLVNNETGLELPVEEIARTIKRLKPEVLIHTDGVQAFLRQPIKLRSSGIDLMSISGHKVRAPKGIGALYVHRGIRLLPRLYGGGQQKGIRSGTEPVPLIAALGAAAAAQKDSVRQERSRFSALKERLAAACREIAGVTMSPVGEGYAPHIATLSLRGIRSEVLLHFLEQYGIYVSSGSACSRGKQSPVLKALGVDRQTADETIRVSFGAETTEEAVDELAVRLEEALHTLAKVR